MPPLKRAERCFPRGPRPRAGGLRLGFARGLAGLGILALLASGPALAGQEPALTLEHAPVNQFTFGQPVEFKAVVQGEPDFVNLYFRPDGVDEFQVRPLDKAPDGSYVFALETLSLPGMEFAYYLEAGQGESKAFFPVDAPGSMVHVTGAGEAPPSIPADIPTPQAEEARFRFPVNITGSGLATVYHKTPPEGVAREQGSGNLRVTAQYLPPARLGISLDANFAGTSVPPQREHSFDLSNMLVTVTKGAHSLHAGDLNLNESEYSVYGLGRRGFDYSYDNQKLYLHAFTIGTQEVRGFKGFGFPGENVRLVGAAAGSKLFGETVFLKAILVSGKDTPSRGVNVGAVPDYGPRQGNVVSLVGETHFFRQALNLRGEFASSRYAGDLDDSQARKTDVAYQFGFEGRLGSFNAAARYRYIGRDFNSIGLPYIANDRRGADASLGYAKGILNLQGLYSHEQDNVTEDPARPTTAIDSEQVNGTLSVTPRFVLNAGYRHSFQGTEPGSASFEAQDLLTDEITGGLTWMPSEKLSLNLTAVSSEISSRDNPSLESEALTFNAGGALSFPEVWIFSPSLSWSRSKSPAAGTTTTVLNACLTTELYLVRQVLSIGAYGSAGWNESTGMGDSTVADLTAALNVQAGHLLKLGTITLSLRGNVNRTDMAGQKITDVRVFVQGDASI
jgi:hypothetical protein